MTAAKYPQKAPDENSLGLHYSRFQPLDPHKSKRLPVEKSQSRGRIGQVGLSLRQGQADRRLSRRLLAAKVRSSTFKSNISSGKAAATSLWRLRMPAALEKIGKP
jgi:hypothetical protein